MNPGWRVAEVEAEDRGSRRRLIGLACAIGVAMTGGAIQAVSGNLRFQNADSLVPVFVSLYGWTPFFWDQDRFGMLVPFLALPFQDPFSNLVFQQVLRSAAALAAPLALARLLAPVRYWLPAGLLALATWLGLLSLPAFAVASFQPYPTAVCLGSAGILLLEGPGRGRRAAGAAATLLGVWVAPTMVLWSIPLAVARSLLTAAPPSARSILRERLGLVVTSLVSIVLVQALAAHWPGISRPTRLELVAPADGWLGLTTFVSRWSTVLSPALVGVDVLLAVLLLCLHLARRTDARRRLATLALAPLLTAFAEAAVLGSIWWFHGNGLSDRYIAVGLLLLCLQPFLVLAGVLDARAKPEAGSAVPALVLCSLLAVGGLLAHFGFPSVAGARRVLDTQMNRSIGGAVLATNDARCTHLLGEYWRVFPVAFAANALRAESGPAEPPVWPLTGSSRMMRRAWEPPDWGAARVCVLANDSKWQEMADHVGLSIARSGEPGVRPVFLSAAVGEPGSGAGGQRIR